MKSVDSPVGVNSFSPLFIFFSYLFIRHGSFFLKKIIVLY